MDAISVMDTAAAGRRLEAPSAPSGDRVRMRKAAQDFEAQFLGQMFQLAMKDIPVDDMFGGGAGERMFRDLLTESWAEQTALSGGLGIADAVMRSLIEMQGEQP